MTSDQITSIQIGIYLEEIAAFLNTLRIDSDGGGLVISRTANDFAWLSGKLKSGDYIAHIPNHMHGTAFTALSEAATAGEGVQRLHKR